MRRDQAKWFWRPRPAHCRCRKVRAAEPFVTKCGANCQAAPVSRTCRASYRGCDSRVPAPLGRWLRRKIDDMPRRLIAVIVAASLSAAFGLDRFAALPAQLDLRLLNVIFIRSRVVPPVRFAARGVFDGRR